MHLTQQTDYALRVLIYTGIHQERLVTIAEIATAYAISKNHLMKIVTMLVRGGFLCSIRGKSGGLKLGKTPEDIFVGHVVRHMEPMHLAECMKNGNSCRLSGDCLLTGILNEAMQLFLTHLDDISLAQLITPPMRQRLKDEHDDLLVPLVFRPIKKDATNKAKLK